MGHKNRSLKHWKTVFSLSGHLWCIPLLLDQMTSFSWFQTLHLVKAEQLWKSDFIVARSAAETLCSAHRTSGSVALGGRRKRNRVSVSVRGGGETHERWSSRRGEEEIRRKGGNNGGCRGRGGGERARVWKNQCPRKRTSEESRREDKNLSGLRVTEWCAGLNFFHRYWLVLALNINVILLLSKTAPRSK